MFLLILTLTLCLTKASVSEVFDTTSAPDYSDDPIYNVNDWVVQLQLQRCAFIAIGLKYFAIFVEDEILGKNGSEVGGKYFLGICQQDVLEEWKFCSPSLAKKRKYKCRFKLKNDRFQPRVHRRFCDFRVMVNNKDCKCAPSIFGDELFKVRGFPTCYMPPLPNSLCRYNVCGVNQCVPVTVEDRIHTVNCSSNCKGHNPFCESPTERTSRFPVVRSFWSEWKHNANESRGSAVGKKLSVATCINKYTGGGGLDCLGPGTGCCPKNVKNCTCDTFEEKGVLKVKRTVYTNQSDRPRRSCPFHPSHILNRYLRGTNDDDEDLEDDDDDDEGDTDEDIMIEDNPEDEEPVSTTEELEKEEAIKELRKDVLEEIRNSTNSSMLKTNTANIVRGMYLSVMIITSSVVLEILVRK